MSKTYLDKVEMIIVIREYLRLHNREDLELLQVPEQLRLQILEHLELLYSAPRRASKRQLLCQNSPKNEGEEMMFILSREYYISRP